MPQRLFFTFSDINKSEQKRNLKKLIKLPLDITSLGGVYFNENINTKSSNLKKKLFLSFEDMYVLHYFFHFLIPFHDLLAISTVQCTRLVVATKRPLNNTRAICATGNCIIAKSIFRTFRARIFTIRRNNIRCTNTITCK